MTATWLEVPLPAGDVTSIRLSATELRAEAEAVLTQQLRLAHTSAVTLTGWEGAAAGAFEITEKVAEDSLAVLATTYLDTATQLESYAEAWTDAQDAAGTAEWSINDAVETYTAGAQSILGEAVQAVNGFVDGAAGLLDAVLPGDQSGLTDFITSLTSWSPPDERAALRLVDPSSNTVTMPIGVLGAVQESAAWGVSHLLDGAGWVIDLVGDAINWVWNALRDLEETLSERITQALHHVHQAFDALVDLGAEVAARVADAAQAVAAAVWQATVRTAAAVGDLGKWLLDHVDEAASFEAALLALALLLRPRVPAGRRGSRQDQDRRDLKALNDFRNRAYRDHANALRLIAGNDVYEDEQTYKLPDGWRRLNDKELGERHFDPDLLDGPTDFNAAVYVTDTGSYVVAFRGTEPTHLPDVTEDLVNAGNLPSSQGKQAIRVAQAAAKAFGDNGLEFTGHSLGGSLAAIGSLATGHHATTFNAAGVGDGNYASAVMAGGSKANEDNIVNISGKNDPLTNAQALLGLDQASGAHIVLGSTTNVIDAHSAKNIEWPDDPQSAPVKVH